MAFTMKGSWTRERLLSLAPSLVSIVLAIALAAQCVALVTTLLPARADKSEITKFPRPMMGPPRNFVDVQSIVQSNMFGARVPDEVDPTNAPVTQQPLVLTATFAMPDPKQGYAILGESIQSARLYSVGANVEHGAVLSHVFSDRVILNRGGTLETLQLPRDRSLSVTNDAPPVRRPASTAAPASSPVSAAQNPNNISQPFSPFPAYRDGRYHGMRVMGTRDADQVARLGLKIGDVITQINGTVLTDPQMARSLLRDLGTTQLNVTIERGGKTLQAVLN
jgi:general secretion pathway protein C